MRVTDGPLAGGSRLEWLPAEIIEERDETPSVRSLFLKVTGWRGHIAGQHVDVRLTADDGYQAQRSYSIASAPGAPLLELTVQRLATGEVSGYLAGEARPGDRFELRGPIGGHFTWSEGHPEPLALVAGGSGVVPLMSMLRRRAATGATAPAALLYSSRRFADIIYREELERMAAETGLRLVHTLTDDRPAGWTGPSRRIDRAMLEEVIFPPSEAPRIYVCGPAGLVETAAQALVEIGHTPGAIKTERFGPTGK